MHAPVVLAVRGAGIRYLARFHPHFDAQQPTRSRGGSIPVAHIRGRAWVLRIMDVAVVQ